MSRRASYLVQVGALAAVYFGAARLGLALDPVGGFATLVWPPTGLALAALLAWGPRLWPGVALGAFLANAWAGAPPPVAGGIAAGNTLEAVVAVWALRRVGFRPALDRMRDVGSLWLLAAVLSTTLSATAGVASLWAGGVLPAARVGLAWGAWWLGDLMGALVVTPLLLTWGAGPPVRPAPGRVAEALGLGLALAAVGLFVFFADRLAPRLAAAQWPYLVFPVLLWAALRFGPRGAAAANFALLALAVWGTAQGAGPFAGPTLHGRLAQLQAFMAVASLTTLVLAAVIAERAQAEAALRESETRVRLAVEGAGMGWWDIDMRTGRTTWSSTHFRLMGYEPAPDGKADYEMWRSRVHPDDVDRVMAALERARHEGSLYAPEHRVIRADDGRVVWLQVAGRFMKDRAGRSTRFVGILLDITERKRGEDEIRRLNAALEHRVAERTVELETANDHLAAANRDLEAFGYSVAHDLRAPLRALQGFSAALLEDYAGRLDETGQDYVRRLAGAASNLDRLVQDLLVFSRVSRADLPLEPVELARVVAQAKAQVQENQSGPPYDWLTVDGPLPLVRGHAATLVQVVMNLLSNAIKFVRPGVAPRVRAWAEARDGRVRLWIEDQGIGIAPEHQARIFRVFERLHGAESYPGTGIGLAIVARGVERMGGRVGVESTAGQGSRFWIELPTA